MKQRMVVGGLALVMTLCLAGCGASGPSLTAAELAKKYPEKKYVQLDGVSLHYEQDGLGRPLIFLHGIPTDYLLWRNITPALTYGNTIYNLDLMGFGLSEKPANQTYSLDTYVGQLSKLIANFHLDNPILVGHEIGGVIATLYTLRNPGKVRKLIIMDAPLYSAAPPLVVRLLRTRLVGDLFTGDWFLKRILRGGMIKPELMTDAIVNDYLKPYHEDPGARSALLKCVRELNLRPVLENEVQANLGKIQIPTLIVWGADDPYVPLDFAKKLKDEIPNSELYVVLRSGHYVQEERGEDVRAALKEFIDK
ncbi:MAG TPA: alpha/beta fold hydrolase [Candidatus Binatia bacterium]|nr:alpha/beta fold hydrolase [Candidatus Binatia bacterium]